MRPVQWLTPGHVSAREKSRNLARMSRTRARRDGVGTFDHLCPGPGCHVTRAATCETRPDRPGPGPRCAGVKECQSPVRACQVKRELCCEPSGELRTVFDKNCFQISVKITSEAELDERGQRGQAWSQQLEMASVLSGWYGYNIHNIFNVANFIEYEPYPKRRKLDKSNNYLTTESLPPCESECRESNTRVRSHNVTYRPYSDLHHNTPGVKQKSSKKQLSGKSDVAVRARVQQDLVTQPEGTTIDDLFPEILCLIFEQLDLQSKGRVAQVKTDKYMKYFIASVRNTGVST